MPTTPSSKYRPEIDGLRAFAVVAVIITHFNKDLLPSGYLGVDIFFVISGYVITSSLADRKSKNFLDFLTGFYERRIKRLVPALVVFVLITSLLISLFNPEPGVALGLGWKSLFGVSNISLYRSSTDYFAQSTELNPFTHTWSLGVEEQFYLLFPFLIWFSGFGQQTAKGARNLFFWVGAMTIASLLGFIYLYQVNQPAAYFLMPPRFWEMAAGCLLFIGFQKRARIEQALEQVPPLLVVAAMTVVMFRPIGGRGGTIAIVLLSAVLIACLKKGTVAYKFFTLEKVVYIGLISYSLYLWHWAVLSISRWTIGIHWWSVPIQIGLMVLLANASYFFIEKPIRSKSALGARLNTIILGTAFSCVSAFLLYIMSQEFIKSRIYVGNKSGIAYEFSRLFSASISSDKSKCIKAFSKCLAHEKSTVDSAYLFWIGDSHTTHILPLAEMLYRQNGANYAAYQSGGDFHQPYPTLTFDRQGRGKKNISNKRAEMQDSFRNALDFRNLSAVVISSNLPLYFGVSDFKFYDKNQKHLSNVQAFELWLKEVEKIAILLKRKSVNLIVILPVPQFGAFPGAELCSIQPWRLHLPDKCKLQLKESAVQIEHNAIRSEIYGIRENHPNVFVFDPLVALCNGELVRYCRNFRGNTLLYMDNNHLTKEGSLAIYPEFAKFLRINKIVN